MEKSKKIERIDSLSLNNQTSQHKSGMTIIGKGRPFSMNLVSCFDSRILGNFQVEKPLEESKRNRKKRPAFYKEKPFIVNLNL